jgi:hypothetical protein
MAVTSVGLHPKMISAKTPKMKKHGLNIKLLFADFLGKGTFCSEIKA